MNRKEKFGKFKAELFRSPGILCWLSDGGRG